MNVDGHLLLKQSVLPASAEWNGAWECWRFFLIQKGEGYWVGPGDRRVIASGQMGVVPPGAKGVLHASSIGPMTIQHFQFCANWLSELLTLSERQSFERLASSSSEAIFFAAAHPLAKAFAEVAESGTREKPFLNRCHLVELAAKMLGSQAAAMPRRREHAIFACERFQQLISQYTEKEILLSPIGKLAEFCNCSPRHFRALFRKQFGVSLKTQQLRMRLRDAATLLRDTKLAVEELARQCGYEHTRSFGIAFKREFGCTPNEWRRGRGNGVSCETAVQKTEILTES